MLFFILINDLFSCNNPNETRQANEKLINQYFAYFNKHDWGKLADMYDEFAEFKDPTFGKDIVKQSRRSNTGKSMYNCSNFRLLISKQTQSSNA